MNWSNDRGRNVRTVLHGKSSKKLTVAWTELSKGKRSKKHYLGTSCISSVDERAKHNNFIDARTILTVGFNDIHMTFEYN